MKARIGATLVTSALVLSASAAFAATNRAAEAKATVATPKTTDIDARRVARRYPSYPAYARYPRYPTYYARPYYYRPYPYDVPVPFFLGFGYLPYY